MLGRSIFFMKIGSTLAVRVYMISENASADSMTLSPA